MSSTRAKVEKLEADTGAGERCGTCGRRLDGKPGRNVVFKLHTDGTPLPPAVACRECGRMPVRFTFNIGTPGRDVE